VLDDVLNLLDKAEAKEKANAARVKKVKEKKIETLDEAFKRVSEMKLNDTEREIVATVHRMLVNQTLQRVDPTKKLSKKEVFELWQVYQTIEKESKKKVVVETKPDNYFIIQTPEKLNEVRALLANEPITAWDTETTGLDIYNDVIVGYSAYLPKADIAFYVPFGHTTGQEQVAKEMALEVAREYLEDSSHKTIWHHYKYDGHMLLNHGITVANPYWDTQVCAKLLNEHESARLKDLHAKYVKKNGEAIHFDDLFDDAVIYDKDVILSGIYAAGDAHKTFDLYFFQKPFIDTRDNLKTVWYNIEQKLLEVDLIMERTGFKINLEMMKSLEERFNPILAESEQSILSAYGIDDTFVQTMSEKIGKSIDAFNIQSNEHLAYLIYDVLGVDEKIGLRFKKNIRSTASEVIDAIVSDHEDLAPLKRYRQLFKLASTYLRKIPNAMEPKTGRLHSRFNNLAGDDGKDGTATGRYSSSEYVSAKHSKTIGSDGKGIAKGTNLQNIPSKGEGVLVRMCFEPDPDWIFVSSDLSQIEPRIISVILAEKFDDPAMQQFYIDGKDLYTTMAMATFNFDEQNCVDGAYDPSGSFQPRKLMKQGVLAYLYGQSAKSFARTMKVTDEVAQVFFDGMLSAFVGLKPFREQTINGLLTKGPVAHVETLFGRKRRFPDYRKEYAELQQLNKKRWGTLSAEESERRNLLWRRCAYVERAAINTIIQGSAADVLKMSLAAMSDFCKKNSFKLHCSIHDEIMISVPKNRLVPEVIESVDNIMTRTTVFSTPLKCDTVIQPRWQQEYKAWKEWDFAANAPIKTARESYLSDKKLQPIREWL
jgi:DNA polymerase-1